MYWHADAGVTGRDLQAKLTLVNRDGGVVVAESENVAPGNSRQPGDWQPNELVRDVRSVRIPPTTPNGRYEVVLAGSGGETVVLGQVEVRGRAHSYSAPAPLEKADATFAGAITLLGYDLGTPDTPRGEEAEYRGGETVRLTLYWQAVGPPGSASLTVFTHITDERNLLVAQKDGVPSDGAAPTNTWLPGEVVTDAHEIVLPVGVAPGSYAIEVGACTSQAPASARRPLTEAITRFCAASGWHRNDAGADETVHLRARPVAYFKDTRAAVSTRLPAHHGPFP